jgi:hypothetical protein
MYAALFGRLGYAKHQSGLRPLRYFATPQFGQGSLLRNALLPAPNVSYLNTLNEMPPKVVHKIILSGFAASCQNK